NESGELLTSCDKLTNAFSIVFRRILNIFSKEKIEKMLNYFSIEKIFQFMHGNISLVLAKTKCVAK
ncbi:TPA: hypothetical protein ACSLAX_002469, partial [Listeria innocua]